MQKDKYALLDTDFISKTHIIQKDADNHLIDRIMELPGYQFFCHSQIRTELSRHNVTSAMEWLKNKISTRKIKCYSDENILDKLENVYGAMALGLYANLLQKACQAYAEGFYENNFKELQEVDYGNIAKSDFLRKLKEDCDTIGAGNHLGEQIYVFCSDARNAKSGIVSIGGVRCISVLSAFIRLKKECGFGQEEAKDYIKSWLDFCAEHMQTTFKVQENAKVLRMCKVPCEQVMREIYEEKLEETRMGYLRYKS